jgi:translation initiation factor IF-3
MSRYHLTSTSRALYRVFVAPYVAPLPHIPLQCAPTGSRNVPFLPITSVRTRIGGPKKAPAKRQALSDIYTFDNAIQADAINLIDEKGTFRPNIYFQDAMRKFNRVTHHLLLISEGRTNELGEQDPEHLPTCKIITKIDLRSQYNRKIEIATKLQKGPSSKNLELNWAIAGGDLKHRLEKLKTFLKEGKKVEVVFGFKKRGKKATEAEANGVLKAVTDAVDECKGAGELKREGVVGGVMTIVYQGTRLQEPKSEKEIKSGNAQDVAE